MSRSGGNRICQLAIHLAAVFLQSPNESRISPDISIRGSHVKKALNVPLRGHHKEYVREMHVVGDAGERLPIGQNKE